VNRWFGAPLVGTLLLISGTLLLISCVAVDAGPSDDRAGMLRALAAQAGSVLGAASSCPNISPTRIDAIIGKIASVVKSSLPNGDENTAILDLFNKSQSEGARLVAAKQIDCAIAERRLADLELASSPAPQSVAVPGPALLAAFTEQEAAGAVRGVTSNEIRLGVVGPFSGPVKDYGPKISRGIEVAFRAANDVGGVHGRKLRLITGDDGFDPGRTAEVVKKLYEKDQVFGFIGNSGGLNAKASFPYIFEHHILCFGEFSGSTFVRNDPPDRYVFNYRASYAEESTAMVYYLVKQRHLKPEQIAVFSLLHPEADAGFAGVEKAMRALRGGDAGYILHLRYGPATIDVDTAIAQLKAHKTPIKAVLMLASHNAAARFVDKTHEAYPGLIYAAISLANATALRDDLMQLGPKYAAGILVTQTVPAAEGYSSLVLEYKAALSAYFGGEAPDYISLEAYVSARILIEALKRAGPQLDTERVVETLEAMRDFDLGLGTPISFSRSDHQAVHKVWGTQLIETGTYEPIELQ